jgi:uncharacterized protein (TIGR02266 family)
MTMALDDRTLPEIPVDAGRRLGRFELDVPVHLSTSGGISSAVIRNISTGGMFLALPHMLAVGDRVLVRLTVLEKADPLEINAEVRWSRGLPGDAQRAAGIGVRFIDRPARAARFFRVVLRRRSGAWS